ncbi:MAG: hypothetical protein AAF471_08995, partial [Myxococcota bacterium]
TAVALAVTLGARCCEIYSDVAGVHTADPRLVHTARPLQRLDPDSMHELASCGARVLNAQAVALARDHGIAIHARKTGSDQPGTVIEKADCRTSSFCHSHKTDLARSRDAINRVSTITEHSEMDSPFHRGNSQSEGGEVIALAHQSHLLSFVVPGSCRMEEALRALTNQDLHIVHVGAGHDSAGKDVETLVVTLPHPTTKPRDMDPRRSLPLTPSRGGDDKEINPFSGIGIKRGPDLAAVSWISRGRIADSLGQALGALREQQVPVRTIFCSATRAGVFVDPTVMRQALQLLHDRFVGPNPL